MKSLEPFRLPRDPNLSRAEWKDPAISATEAGAVGMAIGSLDRPIRVVKDGVTVRGLRGPLLLAC